MKTIAIIVTMHILCFSLANVSAADTLSRPKIGLVLSGGAAKGLAHIGVLKVLEEVGIKPDYITGTSMGAVVGGLYAMGYTPDEISAIAQQADWEFLLSDRLPLNKVAFEEKYAYKRFVLGFPIRNYKFKLPSGIIQGQQLEKLFAGLMWPLEEDINFEALPVPFHCIGVDLLSGKTIEFTNGNLAESIRASMSIPSIFAPESIDSMLLVDGGTMRNFPVEEVRNMGADIVIGVYVGFDNHVSKEDMFSMSDVLSRSTVLNGIIDSNEQLKNLDILIQPDLENLSASDFHKADKFEESGKLAALQHKKELLKLADTLTSCNPQSSINKVPEKIKIHAIHVINDRSFISDRFVIAHSGLECGDYVSREDVSEAIDRIYGTQYFQKVTYSLEKQFDGTYDLTFKVKELTRAYLNFAAHYSNQYGPELISNLTLRNYLVPETRTSISFSISENPDLYFDMNKYFGKRQRIMKSGFFHWNSSENYLYEKGIDIGTYKLSSLKTGIGGKYSLSANHQIGISAFYERQEITPMANLKLFFDAQSFKNYSYKGLAYKLSYQFNTTDDNFFPKKGIKIDIWHKYLHNLGIHYNIREEDKELVNNVVFFRESQQDFNMTYLNVEKYTTFLKRITLNIGASIGNSSDESVGMGNFVIGGVHYDRRPYYIPYAGKNFAENIAAGFRLIRSGIDIEIFHDLYISGQINLISCSENSCSITENFKKYSLCEFQKGYYFGIKAKTLLGPVSLLLGGNDTDTGLNCYFSLGYPF